jgi:sensor histidine kinase regulating citrate/malate metabolism
MLREIFSLSKIVLISALLSLLALIFSLLAWQRTERMSDVLQLDARQSALQMEEERAQRDEVRRRLEETRRQVAAGVNPQEIRGEVADIRAEVRRYSALARAEMRESWRSVDSDLEKIQGQLEEGSLEVLSTVDALTERLRQEIRAEE